MTTDELERDLKMLAEPREADEGLRLAIRAQWASRCSCVLGAGLGPGSASAGPR